MPFPLIPIVATAVVGGGIYAAGRGLEDAADATLKLALVGGAIIIAVKLIQK